MKKSILLLSITLIAANINSQSPKDTFKIESGKEYITLPIPKRGNKITINLEDSSEITHISVSKMKRTPNYKSIDVKNKNRYLNEKKISWFNEFEIGSTILLPGNSYKSLDTARYHRTEDFAIGINTTNRTSFINITPERVYPGLNIGFNFKETRRVIGNSNLNLLTGLKFRFAMLQTKGVYQITEVKSEINNGVLKYYADSVTSITKGSYTSNTNYYHLILPFMIEFKSRNTDLNYSLGLHMVLGFNSTKITTKSVNNIKYASNLFEFTNPQVLQIQPAIKVNYKKLSVQLSTNIRPTRLGYGATEQYKGNLMFLSLGYKIH